jgi:hypothetical protein
MSKAAYDAAFEMLKSEKDFEDRMIAIGFNFEYGSGFVGKHFETILNNCETIIKESLGMHPVSKEGTCEISGINYPITIDILYPEDENDDFSITEDDFCEFCYAVLNNPNVGTELQDLMWKSIVERDVEAKEKFNSFKHGLIGTL